MNPCIAMDYIENCLKIKTKSGTVVPFRLNDAQRKLYAVAKRQQDAGKPVRLIILKARQLGFSTLTEGLIFHACATRKNVNALIVAHREDATANLFRMSKLFYDELPAPVKPMLRASNAQELVFENPSKLRSEREARPGLRSRIRCATAGGRGIGRSDTLQCVHLSEYAFWPDGADGKASTLAGILQAVPSLPGTMVVIESTANGFEDFKERWDAAVAGENDFEPVFFAWFENPDYSMPVVPGTEWTPEERDLKAAYQLTDGQLQWRRWCIANNCGGSLDMFRQEYPASPGEAFLHSGTGVFDNEQIVLRLERKYSEPEYVRQIYALGRFYNDALVAIETNFSTYPVMKLQEMEYANQYSREREDTYTRQMKKSYGFRTDRQSRPRAIANLVEVFSSHPEWFTDRELLEEMLTFCYNEDHRPEALAGKHDDLVMGAAITYAVRHQQRMTVLTEPEKPREKLIDQMKRQRRARKAW